MNRDTLYKELDKWIYLPDKEIIDVIMATYVAMNGEGVPLWIWIIAKSGGLKTALLKPMIALDDVKFLDEITEAGIQAGTPNTKDDLFTILSDGKPRLILIIDLSVLYGMKADKKKRIFAKFRNLYDGTMAKRTAMISRTAHNIKVGMLVGLTPTMKNDKIIFNSNVLGTRELSFAINNEYLKENIKKAESNNGKEDEMNKEMIRIYNAFLLQKKYKNFPLPPHIYNYLVEKVKEIAILRGSGELDWKGNSYDSANIEMPTRPMKQLSRLYSALKSIDENYPENRFKKIVENITRSSGNEERYRILRMIKKKPNETYRVRDFDKLLIPKRIVSRELEFLWMLGILDRKTEEEMICNRWQEVNIYSMSKPTLDKYL